jgi:hypothetical protein
MAQRLSVAGREELERLPNRFASLDQCRDYFAEYVKGLRHPPHPKVAFECEQRP